jgi:hypothetical protein
VVTYHVVSAGRFWSVQPFEVTTFANSQKIAQDLNKSLHYIRLINSYVVHF